MCTIYMDLINQVSLSANQLQIIDDAINMERIYIRVRYTNRRN